MLATQDGQLPLRRGDRPVERGTHGARALWHGGRPASPSRPASCLPLWFMSFSFYVMSICFNSFSLAYDRRRVEAGGARDERDGEAGAHV